MKRTFLAPSIAAGILAAGLSISQLPAQHGPQTNGRASGNQTSASSMSVAYSTAQPAPVIASSQIGTPANLGLAQLTKMQVESSWGMTTMPLPKYLRNPELGLAPNQGLLVTELIPGMSAASSGIEPGSLIIEIDGVPLMDNQQLPILQAEHKLMVMCDIGLKEICVKPFVDNLLGIDAVDQLESQGNAFSQIMPQLGLNLRGFPNGMGRIANMPAPRSLSVSEVNGEITVTAIVNGAEGPVRIELQGCRAEIANQLAQLPADVQAQLAPHIGL